MIKLAVVTVVVALVSLWRQVEALDLHDAGFPANIDADAIVTGACTIFIILAVGTILWRSIQDMRRTSRLAFVDELTGLPNRRRFDAVLRNEIAGLKHTNSAFGLLYLDLDRFKNINDSYGHDTGDEVIAQFGKRVAALLRDHDFLARLAGDEFAVILSPLDNTDEMEEVARRVFAAMGEPVHHRGRMIYAGLSIGAVMVEDNRLTAAEVLRRADFALLQAKESGRNNIQIFDPAMAERIRSRGALENDLREAIINERFQIKYQPLISQRENRVLGVEALVRWIHPKRGPIAPAVFIPVAEEIGMIDRLGEIVLRRACAEIRSLSPILLAVNVSPQQFIRSGFVDRVRAILAETGFDPHKLELEITEGVFISDAKKTAETIERFRQLGVRIALDDFGTGYSSMSYLRDYPLDRIKIDRSFVSKIGNSGKSANLVSKLIDLGSSLGLSVTVEGVETEDQLRALSKSGCELQGYLFSHPVSLSQLREYCAGSLIAGATPEAGLSATA